MPPATAAAHDAALSFLGIPNGTFEAFRLKACASPPKNTDFPVLLFSTGAGNSRLTYSVLCQWVASMGFNVVSIDHTYDAPIVEFPDGTVITAGNITFTDDLQKVLAVRTADVLSVLKAFSNSTTTKELGIPLFKTKQVGVFGHSLGGATAANAMLLDPRLIGGLNMDGSVPGQAMNKTQKNPFTIFAAQNHTQSSDATWAAFWQQLKGMKLQLQVNGSAHGTFSDYPVLASSVGVDPTSDPAIAELIGSIDGVRVLNILRSYIGGFFQEVLGSKQVKLLQGPSPQFPEVSFVNVSLTAT
jgi:pimeloyl-ACP methyl ester carboxylesterase